MSLNPNGFDGQVSQPPRGKAWAITQSQLVAGSRVLHWTGRRWMVIPRPYRKGPLYAVLALSNADVWFAGQTDKGDMLTEHWNGKRISVVPNALSWQTPQALTGIRSNSVWLLALDFPGDLEVPYVEHWNGSRWSKAKAPPSLQYGDWSSISAHSTRDIWVIGYGLAHWNGSVWHTTYSRSGSDVLDFGRHDVWTVGGYHANHFDGRNWHMTRGAGPYAQAIAGLAHGPLYAAGSSNRHKAVVLRWTRSRWVRVKIPLPKGSSDFGSVGVSRKGEVWAAGFSNGTSTYGGDSHDRALIEHYLPCSQPGR